MGRSLTTLQEILLNANTAETETPALQKVWILNPKPCRDRDPRAAEGVDPKPKSMCLEP